MHFRINAFHSSVLMPCFCSPSEQDNETLFSYLNYVLLKSKFWIYYIIPLWCTCSSSGQLPSFQLFVDLESLTASVWRNSFILITCYVIMIDKTTEISLLWKIDWLWCGPPSLISLQTILWWVQPAWLTCSCIYISWPNNNVSVRLSVWVASGQIFSCNTNPTNTLICLSVWNSWASMRLQKCSTPALLLLQAQQYCCCWAWQHANLKESKSATDND